ncbi:MAG: PQQ-dependent sugar dehydrogenase [Gemmataceae bacterium]|nr:PQQ-dependent sugar dehydrogenase [Gemmataceae bacterium]
MMWRTLRNLFSSKPKTGTRKLTYRPRLESLETRDVPALLPTGFSETLLASGIAAPTAMEFAPDGRLFIAQQGGALRVVKNGSLLSMPFVSLNVNSSGERGLLGVTFDPNFASNGFVYAYYTTATSPIHNRVSRFTANGDVAVAGSEVVLMDLEALSATNHNGGAIHFGLDGKLYIAVGENAVPSNSQSLNNRLGKILRINPDGSIPTDNPFFLQATGVNRAIWALGLRNPFTFAVQPDTGRMFINDVGAGAFEEINEGVAGANYGWPNVEGPGGGTIFRDPFFNYAHGQGFNFGNAIVGGAFYNPAQPQFPANYMGTYFFGDLTNNWIRVGDPTTGNMSLFATDVNGGTLSFLVDIEVGPDGKLYYLSRGFGANTGALFQVQFNTLDHAPVFSPINDQTFSTQSMNISLNATDGDGDSITYLASAQSLAFILDQRNQFFSTGNLHENFGGRNERWMLTAGGLWHFILPNGELYRWDGQAQQATGPFVAALGSDVWENPNLLMNATPNPRATLTVNGSTLTVTRDAGTNLSIFVTAVAGAGQLADFEYFTLSVQPDRPPELSPIADRTLLHHQQSVTVSITATDPDGETPTLSATAQPWAFVLDQQLGLNTTGNLWFNFGGKNEIWVQAANGQWYFLLPNGELYRQTGPAATGTLIATIGTTFYANPSALYNAQPTPHATLSFSGNDLTVTRQAGFSESLVVTVRAADGPLVDTESFKVIVLGNRPPTVSDFADVTIPNSQQTVTANFSVSDPDGDTFSVAAAVAEWAFVLDQQFGFKTNGNLHLNWGGRNEEWILDANNKWYFILPNGELYRWNESATATGTLIGKVGVPYWTNPSALYNAVGNAHASASVAGNTLTVTRDGSNFAGTLLVTLTASDAGLSASKSFHVFIS